MKMSDALEGYFYDKRADGYSPHTISLYKRLLPRICAFLGDPEIEKITLNDLKRCMVWVQEEYVPNRIDGDTRPLSGSAVANHWKSIRSFFAWAEETFELKRPDEKLKCPKYQEPPKTPYTEKEIKRLLDACEYATERQRKGQRAYRAKRPNAQRDRALILFLLDTGLRVGETCRVRIEDVNMETGEVLVTPHGSGQKSTARHVYLGKRAKRELWKYLAKRTDWVHTDKLFELENQSVRTMLRRLGEKADVANATPHQFRHTFAITFLRNGGTVFALQKLLGHTDLTMVERYLALAQSDVEKAHRKASPADNWRL